MKEKLKIIIGMFALCFFGSNFIMSIFAGAEYIENKIFPSLIVWVSFVAIITIAGGLLFSGIVLFGDEMTDKTMKL